MPVGRLHVVGDVPGLEVMAAFVDPKKTSH